MEVRTIKINKRKSRRLSNKHKAFEENETKDV